jgi:hypothetical protein
MKLFATVTACLSLAIVASAAQLSPRAAYNHGVEALEQGRLGEAESWLRGSIFSQRESLQPPALYNLGHVRFRQGEELLKGESPRQPLIDRADTATEDGTDAVMRADRALKSDELMALLDAYLSGRATRKQLRAANEDVQRALDLYGSVLTRWRRSLGDFRSSDELRTSEDAKFNARVVERRIEELLKHVEQLEQRKKDLAGMRGDLKKKLAELKGKLPKELMQQQGPGGDEEDEEEENGPQPTPESGWQDQPGREGEKRGITPEIAQQILEALGLKGDRKLPLGGEEQAQPRDRKGKDW